MFWSAAIALALIIELLSSRSATRIGMDRASAGAAYARAIAAQFRTLASGSLSARLSSDAAGARSLDVAKGIPGWGAAVGAEPAYHRAKCPRPARGSAAPQ